MSCACVVCSIKMQPNRIARIGPFMRASPASSRALIRDITDILRVEFVGATLIGQVGLNVS